MAIYFWIQVLPPWHHGKSDVDKFLELFGEDLTLVSEMNFLCNPLNV